MHRSSKKVGFTPEEIREMLAFQLASDPSLQNKAGVQEQIHRPLPPELEDITRHTRARIAGCDLGGNYLGRAQEERDAAAIVAMNNALVLRSEDLERELAGTDEDAQYKTIEQYAKSGWQVSALTDEKMNHLLHMDNGYAFLLEYGKNDVATPFGSQIGFIGAPPKTYPSLAMSSLPPLQTFTQNEASTLTIWRTNILEHVESVRDDFARLGIPVHTNLLGKNLHRIGAGQATKVVTAEAAADLKKKFIQFNIGQMVRPDHPEDILARNEASMGSNKEIFDETDFVRSHIDRILDSKNVPLVEIYWKLFRSAPRLVLQRLFMPHSSISVKGWDGEQLQHAGALLAKHVCQRDCSSDAFVG